MNLTRILCIEDNPGDARLIKELLLEDLSRNYAFTHLIGFDELQETKTLDGFDVILLDLDLKDTSGLGTFEKMRSILPDIPIIILTGLKDEALAEEIIQKGAQDYLVKNAINTALLNRSVRYAIERYKLSAELLKSDQLEKQKKEIESLEWIPHTARSKVTERILGIKSLKEYTPDAFLNYSLELTKFMDMAIEAKLYKTDYDVPASLRIFAEKLGHSFAGPQDVVELYSYTLKEKMKGSSPEKNQLYIEEGRVIILMLMGYLVSFYKKYAPYNMIFKDQQK